MNRRCLDLGTSRVRPSFTLTFTLTALGAILIADPASGTTVGPVTPLGGTAAQRAPVISWDPQHQVYVMVWEDARNITNGVDLFVARIAPNGMLQDGTGVVLLEASVLAGNETQPAIAYASTTNERLGHHVIAWTEARDGFPDIFVTRYFAGSGTVVPSAGLQLTSGNDLEGLPSVAVGPETALVAFQANRIGGDVVVGGRRLEGDLAFHDAAAFTLSDPAGGLATNPRAAVLGGTFAVVWEQDANVYGRLLPGTTAGPSGSPLLLVEAPLLQSLPTLSRLGPGGFFLAWQDARGVDRDIFGSRHLPTLLRTGSELLVSGAINDQLRPILASDENHGLLVWQDRRNSSTTGVIYGARLDAAGALRDPAGFPILGFTDNSAEHTVAKGPGADWLVATVRFGSPSSIHFRVVRDEPPSGTLIAPPASNVPADGMSSADLTFGGAVGASGLPVVDGTLYTVTLSRQNVQIGAPDAAPQLPGHQIRGREGDVFLSLSSLAHGQVTVSLSSVEGTSAGQTTVDFTNIPPVATQVIVSPPTPRSNEDLHLVYTYSDVNGDPESGTQIFWTRNAAIQSALSGQRTVPASATRRGDQWRAEVRPRDGIDTGVPVFSNTVVVSNTPPSATLLRITPASDVRTGTPLRGRWNFEDLDGDASSPLSVVRWFESGVEQPDLQNAEDVPGARVVKGQRWHFDVRPHDGIEFGPIAVSSTVSVINTPPVANAGMLGMVLERRRHTLDGRASADIDPQDRLTYSWRQVLSGAMPAVELSSTSSAAPWFTAPSVRGTTVLTFELVVSDGEAQSEPARVTVQVLAVPDTDGDGLDDEEEVIYGTNPQVADTDRDGLSDGDEVAAGLDPLDEDTDDDGVRDGAEGATCRNCSDADPFGDADGDSVINALDPDADGDGIFDGTELGVRLPLQGGGVAPYVYKGTDVERGFFVADEDPTTTTDPTNPDTDGDGFPDGQEDANRNGRVDPGESDPNDPTSPGVPCTAGGAPCPGDLVCGASGICVRPDPMGPMCQPLPANLECCMGGCRGGTVVEPVCAQEGALAMCPLGSSQCNAGACSAGDPVKPPETGCGCSASASREGAAPWGMMVLLGLLGLAQRRRR